MIALTSPGCLHRPCYRLLASTVSSRVLYAGIEGKRQYRFLERIAKGNHSMSFLPYLLRIVSGIETGQDNPD